MDDDLLDVVIIGAGFSGLAAARELHEMGVSFRVLDAYADHLGGRAYSYEERPGLGFDHGAEYVGDLQNGIMKLVRELLPEGALVNGVVQRATAYDEVMLLAGHRYCFDKRKALFGIQGVPPDIGLLSLLGMLGMLAEITLIEMAIDVVEPWKSPDWVVALDSISVEEWLAQKHWLNPTVVDLMRISVEALLSVEPSEISPFYLLWYTASNSGFMNEINDDKGGPQQYWLRTGMSALAEKFAEKFADKIDRGVKVTKVDHGGSDVRIETDSGKTLRAKKLLVATSPHSTGRIAFDPPPPPARQALFDLPMGRTIKCQLFYAERWWWDSKGQVYDGYVGGANYPVIWVMDNTPPISAGEDEAKRPFVLMTFTVGAQADKLGPNPTDDEVQKVVTDALAYLFDDERARKFDRIVIHRWTKNDPFVGGGPNTIMSPGVLSGAPGRLLNEPWGDKIFFASSENARALDPLDPRRKFHLLPLANSPAYEEDGTRKASPAPPYTTHYSDMRRSLGYMDGGLESGRFGAHVVAKSLGLPHHPGVEATPDEAGDEAHAEVPLGAEGAAALLASVHGELEHGGASTDGAMSALQGAVNRALVAGGHVASDDDHRGLLARTRDFAASIIVHAGVAPAVQGAVSALEARLRKLTSP